LLALDRHGPFDLVLLDLILGDPVLDGLAVCQRIRARPNPPPIIMLTVLSLETDMHKGLELGASDYITRPFSNETLRVRIKTLLRTVERWWFDNQTYAVSRLHFGLAFYRHPQQECDTYFLISPEAASCLIRLRAGWIWLLANTDCKPRLHPV
jgi:DNA-binding response OmpR family regulator